MNAVVLGSFVCNLVFVCEGNMSRFNVVGLIFCTIYLVGRLYQMARRPRKVAKT